ncbi:MAG: MSCRAMM family protein [Bacteroidales bacterium]
MFADSESPLEYGVNHMSVVRSALRSASLALVALSAAMASGAGQGLPTAQQRTDCRLTVVALHGETGKPVAGVGLRVMFVPPADEAAIAQAQAAQAGATILREVHSAETDAQGHAVFEALRAGRYSIAVVAPPGLAAPSPTRLVDIAERQSASLTISLGRPGTITGRVVADGRPVSGVLLVPMQWGGPAGGPPQLTPALPAPSPPAAATRVPGNPNAPAADDGPRQLPRASGRDGRFGFGNLAPGEYYLMASAAFVPGRRPEFAPTYYPGSTLLKDAKPVVVRAGEETANVEIPLVRIKPGSVKVKAVASNGAAIPLGPLGRISLVPASEDRAKPQVIAAVKRPIGASMLEFEVPPGDYYAVARLMTDEDPGTGERARGSSSDGRTFWDAEVGYELVSVKDGGSATVTVHTTPGATVSGRVVVEGGRPSGGGTAAAPQDLVIVARPETSPQAPFGMTAQSSPVRDGGFSIKRVHGLVRLSVQGSAAAVKSITRGGEDITGKVLAFKGHERVNDVVVTLTTATSRLEGTVQNAPAEGGMVILFPDDRARWLPGASQARVVRVLRSTDGNGAAPFAFEGLLPGRYLVVALNDTSAVAPIEPESLERLRAAATAVTLGAGETGKIELKAAGRGR